MYKSILFCLTALTIAVPARAELRRVELKVFGMD
jgi:hypothetical protein